MVEAAGGQGRRSRPRFTGRMGVRQAHRRGAVPVTGGALTAMHPCANCSAVQVLIRHTIRRAERRRAKGLDTSKELARIEQAKRDVTECVALDHPGAAAGKEAATRRHALAREARSAAS